MTPQEAQDKLNNLMNEGTKLANVITNDDEAKKVKDYVATVSYYLGMMSGAQQMEALDAKRWRAFRKHMVLGKGVKHPSWIFAELRVIPYNTYTLEQIIDSVTDHDGNDLTVVDRDEA
jgi:hypothetical protein